MNFDETIFVHELFFRFQIEWKSNLITADNFLVPTANNETIIIVHGLLIQFWLNLYASMRFINRYNSISIAQLSIARYSSFVLSNWTKGGFGYYLLLIWIEIKVTIDGLPFLQTTLHFWRCILSRDSRRQSMWYKSTAIISKCKMDFLEQVSLMTHTIVEMHSISFEYIDYTVFERYK